MQRRIIISILLSVSVILVTLGVVSHLNVQRSIRRSLDDHVQQARIIANYTDALLRNNILRLFDISLSGHIDFEDNDWSPEKRALQTAYQYSIFSDGIYLLDQGGNVLLSYPPGKATENLIGNPWVSHAIRMERSLVSDIYTLEKTGRRVIYVLVPLKDVRGEIQGLVVGEIDPTHYVMNRIMQAVPAGDATFLELVDGQGFIIASNVESRLFTGCDHNQFMANLIRKKEQAVATCHRCHETPGAGVDGTWKLVRTPDMLAFAPIAEANWGVAVREPKDLVFSPSTSLKRNFAFLAIIALVSSLILAIGMSRGIVKPVRQLTAATRRIADGNLGDPVHVTSRDEIGILGNSFEKMRTRLSESLEEIRENNLTLERRVEKRTRALQRHRKRLAVLLQEVIDAQENERKRIARELHDETSQSLTALGISMDLSEVALRNGELKPQELQRLRNAVGQVLDRLRLLIRDLRPPVIDDLGLEAAVEWLAQKHLGEKGIRSVVVATSDFKAQFGGRLSDGEDERQPEVALFRVVQEAIVNIERHSNAQNVTIIMQTVDHMIQIFIEDDGNCFDVDGVLEQIQAGTNSGFGILGMKERLALMDGTLEFRSNSGEGTLLTITVPSAALRAENV